MASCAASSPAEASVLWGLTPNPRPTAWTGSKQSRASPHGRQPHPAPVGRQPHPAPSASDGGSRGRDCPREAQQGDSNASGRDEWVAREAQCTKFPEGQKLALSVHWVRPVSGDRQQRLAQGKGQVVEGAQRCQPELPEPQWGVELHAGGQGWCSITPTKLTRGRDQASAKNGLQAHKAWAGTCHFRLPHPAVLASAHLP